MISSLFVLLFALQGDAPRQNGISLRFYDIGKPLATLRPLVPGQTPNVSLVLPVLDLKSGADDKVAGIDLAYTFECIGDGWLHVDTPGKYTLRLVCDDGGKLALDGQTVIDHDGLHALTPRDAELELTAGDHALLVRQFQCYGGWGLSLQWKAPGGSAFHVVPNANLRCPLGEVRVTSPGTKRIIEPLPRGGPGDGMPLDAVNPAYTLATVRPEGFEPRVGGIDWLPDGRMVLSTWDPDGSVWILSGVAGDDRSKIKLARFASGLAEPLGVCCVGERIFVLQKQELTELVDENHDGVADRYRSICADWPVSANFHEFAFGLVYQEGFFYANLAIAIDPGGRSTKPQVEGRGSMLKISLEKGTCEVVARGLRAANGIGFGVGHAIFMTDNQGDWLPASKLLRFESGAFYGSRSVLGDAAAKLALTPPVIWMPEGEIANSPSTPLLIPAGHGPYSGQMCHGDVTYGGMQRDFVEEIDGVWQGCVLRWTQGLEAGINRSSFGPDGALYVGGIGSQGNWGQEGKQNFGLQRLKYNGASVFDLLLVRAKSDGFELEFTEPLADNVGWESENWLVEQWRYVPTEQYGGPKIDEERLHVRSANVSLDRKRVFLELDGLKPDHVVHLYAIGPIVDARGRALWNREAWYTLNRIPKSVPGTTSKRPPLRLQNVLSDAEKAAGWKLLFDGHSLAGWRGFQKAKVGWHVEDGALARGEAGGDLVTDDEYDDFELTAEWKIAEGSNSGIFFHVTEDHDTTWQSGPEMQVLDDEHHPDGQNPLTSAGSNYALQAPPRELARPVGMWNEARILVHGAHVEQWLNGVKCCEYELWSPEWKALVKASKFTSMPDYGLAKKGRIALQDHGDPVWFRNVKLRLPPPR